MKFTNYLIFYVKTGKFAAYFHLHKVLINQDMNQNLHTNYAKLIIIKTH